MFSLLRHILTQLPICAGFKLFFPYLAVLFSTLNAGEWANFMVSGYTGDGEFTVSRSWYYPWYKLRLSAIELKNFANRQYLIKGLPPCEMMVGIYLNSAQDASQDYLQLIPGKAPFASRNEVIELKIETIDGKVLYEQSAPLRDWRVARTTACAYLWLNGQKLHFDTTTTYMLSLKISSSEGTSGAPPFLLQPFISGGGIELP